MILLLGLVVFLYAFASNRNSARMVSEPHIQFIGENNLFITDETVSKLLIQNYGDIKNMPKETLALNVLERALNSNPMIKSAEVYVTVNGTLTAKIEQKRPIAMVFATDSKIETVKNLLLDNNIHAKYVQDITMLKEIKNKTYNPKIKHLLLLGSTHSYLFEKKV